MEKIRLSNSKGFALIDGEDFEYLSQWKWYLNSNGYARATLPGSDKKTYMHQLVNKTPKGLVTDHINRDKLDNRKINLRTVEVIQNSRNRGLSNFNTSGHRGVSWTKTNKWEVYIWLKNKKIHIGRFTDFTEATKARKDAERIYYAT